MTWKQVHDRIETMTEEEQNESCNVYDDNESCWCGEADIRLTIELDSYRKNPDYPKYTLVG